MFVSTLTAVSYDLYSLQMTSVEVYSVVALLGGKTTMAMTQQESLFDLCILCTIRNITNQDNNLYIRVC